MTDLLVELIPVSVGDAFAKNNLAQLVLLTLALGIGLAKIRNEQRARGETAYRAVVDLLTVGFELLMRVLLWVVALVPLAVFGVVASSVGQKEGLRVFQSLLWLIVVVLAGLACQVTWYLVQMMVFARISPWRFLRAASDVMASTFSTASTAATIPITLGALTQEAGGLARVEPARRLRRDELQQRRDRALPGHGRPLHGAGARLQPRLDRPVAHRPDDPRGERRGGGIPSGSFVTLPLIFAAVGLPADKIPVLLTIDWFLDRCRTTSNVLGDMTVAVLLDRTAEHPASSSSAAPEEKEVEIAEV